MEAIVRLNIDDLNEDFIKKLKALFPHREVELKFEDMDATTFISSKPKYAAELLRRIKDYEEGKSKAIEMNVNDLL